MAARKKGTRGRPAVAKSGRRSAKPAARSKKSTGAVAKKMRARVAKSGPKVSKVAKKRPKKSPSRKTKSPLQRITGVAVQVAHQAQTAVSEGVGALREMGENIADRVGGT